MFDVSVTPASDIIAAAFRWSHLVFASTTYNAGIFVTMEAFISDLTAHNIQNRTIAIIENGSWAATSGGLIREKMEKCKNITIINNIINIKSSLKETQLTDLYSMADALYENLQSTSENKPEISPDSSDAPDAAKKSFTCKICGYIFKGDALPEGFACPMCKRGPEDFEQA